MLTAGLTHTLREEIRLDGRTEYYHRQSIPLLPPSTLPHPLSRIT